MRSNNYFNQDESEKCQCITLDESGKIVGSSDTLFETKKMTATMIKKQFPFLWGIISKLKEPEFAHDPLFFPHVEMEE